jgi:NAD(P)H-hydrate epimerase
MYLTRNQVRSIDRRAIEEFGVPGIVLMENAGRGAAEVLLSLGVSGPVTICCGKGNNGGDGFVIARHLDNRLVPVEVLLFARPADLTGDAAIAYRIIACSRIPITCFPGDFWEENDLAARFARSAWLVDALFGTGLSGPVRPPFDRLIALMNSSGVPVLAVDIPSGRDCDTGRPLGETVRATCTVTFVAAKQGFADPAAKPWIGQVHVVDIGAPRILIEEVFRESSS